MDGIRRQTSRSPVAAGTEAPVATPHALGERRASEALVRELSKGLGSLSTFDSEVVEGVTPVKEDDEEEEEEEELDVDALLLQDLKGMQAHISKVYASVFKLFTTHCQPNYLTPWQQQQQFTSIGTGFCIDTARRRFITNAHCVEDAVVVQVLKRGDTKKYFCKVLLVADACDLALLTVESDAFWMDVPALPLSADLCRLQDTVSVLGYPVGGSNISLTQGVVSRLDLTDISQSFGTQSLLTVQIDAAINAGNSGGPVLNARMEVVGVAFQGMAKKEAEGTGYIIPVPVVKRFLDDFEKHGAWTGFTSLHVECQALENEDLRRMHGMGEEQTGIVIRAVAPETHVAEALKVDDVLLSVEGQQVGNDGSVSFLDGERIQVTHLLNDKFRGDLLNVEVLREGEVLSLSFPLENPALLLPPKPAALSYCVVAGLVFLPLSMELLNMRYLIKRFGDSSVPSALQGLEQYCRFKGEEVVVLTNILRHEANTGYDIEDLVRVSKVNGTTVRNLAHLAALVQEGEKEEGKGGKEEKWCVFEFDGLKDKIVLASSRNARTTAEVCEQNNIPQAQCLGGRWEAGGKVGDL